MQKALLNWTKTPSYDSLKSPVDIILGFKGILSVEMILTLVASISVKSLYSITYMQW